MFTVDAVEVYDARNFPDEKVYGAAPRPELRVITCGGGYSRATGYQGNVVAFAHLSGSRAAASPPATSRPTTQPPPATNKPTAQPPTARQKSARPLPT